MVARGAARGPDGTTEVHREGRSYAFHRLAIQDLTASADQPFFSPPGPHADSAAAALMCNGEIYNSRQLARRYPRAAAACRSRSDCEILLPLWSDEFGRDTEALLGELDGVFALAIDAGRQVHLARDRVGVRPLFYVSHPFFTAVASTPGPLQELCSGVAGLAEREGLDAHADGDLGLRIQEVHPRTRIVFDAESGARTVHPTPQQRLDWGLPSSSSSSQDSGSGSPEHTAAREGLRFLRGAVAKRLDTDRPLCCLLSGGIDSSAVACLLVEALRPLGRRLATFSIGQPGSADLLAARRVAARLGTEHHEVDMCPAEALACIPAVVADTATYDVTTVRASTPMWLLCRYIARNTPYRVVFSGEGADEASAGYLYFHHAPPGPAGDRAVEAECRRLVASLHEYDVLRADRCMGAHGLELREPFLDRELLDWALALPGAVRRPRGGTEKLWLRDAMALLADVGAHVEPGPSLPLDIVWRRKAAFSDAVSAGGPGESMWFRQIQAHLSARGEGPPDAETEARAYQSLFRAAYPHYEPFRPRWLPRWLQEGGGEPSASVLPGYSTTEERTSDGPAASVSGILRQP
jgi:asparagine synthase (glutamine-hydrolysing)